MKMNYLLKNKSQKNTLKKILFIVFLFLLISFLVFVFSGFFRSAGVSAVLPVWKAGDFLANPFYKLSDYFSSKNNLIEENKKLKEEISALNLKVIDYDVILKENDELNSYFGRVSGSSTIMAKVLSKPPRSPYDTIVIDIGSDAGVVLGSRVYLSDTVVVGLIKNVTKKTALVELFSSGNLKQEAILSRTGESFILEGYGAGNFRLVTPKDADIIWGDVFLYPSSRSSVIGSVYFIDSSLQSSFKDIYIRVPSNIFHSKYLFVEKSN